ncbi:putative ABC transporter, partial [Aureobasidium sp. EXF-3399]
MGIAISSVLSRQCFDRIVMRFRGAMISLIYSQTLELPQTPLSEGAALTLISTDLDNIIEFLENICSLWAFVLEISIGIWLLERILGVACIVPVIVVLACAAGQTLVARTIGQNQQNWNSAIQSRVKNTAHILGSLKSIKLSGFADAVSTDLQAQRVEELQISRPFFKGILWLNLLTSLPAIWSPFVTFLSYAVHAMIQGRDSVDVVKVFTSLSVINIMTASAGKLLTLLPQIAAALGCFQRIQRYLLSERFVDRQILQTEKSSSTQGGSETTRLELELELRAIPKNYPTPTINFDMITLAPTVASLTTKAEIRASFRTPAGCMVALVGPTGSGKTTLLKAILGEIPCRSGNLSVGTRSIAYCAQDPFILNGSVESKVCGLSTMEFSATWYQKVLEACNLDQDIRAWEDRDMTIVGSKGVSLSGGQKQRLTCKALARAVYSQRSLVLLDDSLSALDNHTRSTVISRLFSRTGIFRKLGFTVVLTAHSVHDVKFADQIVILKSEGDTTVHNSYEHALANETFSYDAKDIREADDEQQSDLSTFGRVEPEPEPEPSKQEVVDTKLQDSIRRTGDAQLYTFYFQTIGLPLLGVFLSATTLSIFTENFSQVWLNWWAAANGKQMPKYLPVYAGLLLTATVSAPICLYIMFLRIMPKSAAELHWKLLRTVFDAPLAFLTAVDSGVTLNRFSQDMSLVDLALPIALSTFVMTCFACVAKICLIATGSSYMAISIPFTLCTVAIIQHIYLKTTRQLRHLDLENKSPLFSHLTEAVEGLATIRAFGWQSEAITKNDEHLDYSQRPYYMLFCVQRWLGLVLDLIVAALAVLVVTLAVKLRSDTRTGLLGVALNNVLSFNQALSAMVTAWTSLETSLGAIARVKSFASTTPSENSPDCHLAPPSSWPSQGVIQIQNISVRYKERGFALKDVNLAFNHGEKIGICGRSGSGKSSLISAMLRAVPPATGTILIDGIDISTLDGDILRHKLITVPQDSFTLPGTVRYNVDPVNESSDAAIKAACEKVGIWTALQERGGLDAILLDHPLSQGEQQLFCLARGLLRKSPVLILDEATSSVDSKINLQIQNVIEEQFADCTVITVAHRLKTILSSDRIVLLQRGRVLEFDTPRNLLASDSMFRRLYRSAPTT